MKITFERTKVGARYVARGMIFRPDSPYQGLVLSVHRQSGQVIVKVQDDQTGLICEYHRNVDSSINMGVDVRILTQQTP